MDGRVEADITELLQEWKNGDPAAGEKVWPIVYSELNRLAHLQMRQERLSHTLQSGALVNELYLRLVDWQKAHWQNRAFFRHVRAHDAPDFGGSRPRSRVSKARW